MRERLFRSWREPLKNVSIVVVLLLPSLAGCGSDSEGAGGSGGSASGGSSGQGGSSGSSQGGSGGSSGSTATGGAAAGGAGATGGSAGSGGSSGSAQGGSAGQATGGSAGAPAGSPLWVGVGNWGYRVSTPDGTQITEKQNPQGSSDHSPDLLRDVAWGNGAFIAVGGDQNSMVMRSTDGNTWQEDLHPSGTQWKGGVAYGGGRWVAVGGVGTVIYSDDGGTVWQDSSERLPSAGRDIGYGGGQFVAVGDSGMIATSSDGLGWTDHTQSGAVGMNGVAYLPSGAWAVTGRNWNGSGFDISCFGSPDGSSWTPCGFNITNIGRPSVVNGELIVPTDAGYESTTNGTTWIHHDTDIPELVLQADSLLVGGANDRLYAGSSIDSISQTKTLTRGLRGFCLGYVQ